MALLERSGGAQAFAEGAIRRLKSARQLQLGAYGGGLMIFFSDLGTPLILGPVFRPLFDRAGLLRARLSLILDATAAPIAILVPFIGWGVYIMSLVAQTPPGAGPEAPYALLWAPSFQFYAWLALALILYWPHRRAFRSRRARSAIKSIGAASIGRGAPRDRAPPLAAACSWRPAVLGASSCWGEGCPRAPTGRLSRRAGRRRPGHATPVLLGLALRILPFATLMETRLPGPRA